MQWSAAVPSGLRPVIQQVDGHYANDEYSIDLLVVKRALDVSVEVLSVRRCAHQTFVDGLRHRVVLICSPTLKFDLQHL
jgi:hypothetical protein